MSYPGVKEMPRQLRLEYEGAAYHVMARGNRRESIFREDSDRLAWLDYLGQVCHRTAWRVYGWVLMGICILHGYLGTVLDYLHLNPVRAGLIGGRSGKGLLDYRWSSLTRGVHLQPTETPQMGEGGSGISSVRIEGYRSGTAPIFGAPRAEDAGGIRSQLWSEDSGGAIPAVHLEEGMVLWEAGVSGTVVSPATKSGGCPHRSGATL